MSVIDLARFADFVLRGAEEVLSAEAWADLRTPQVSTEVIEDDQDYGFGLGFDERFSIGEDGYEEPLISHTGLVPGYQTGLYALPERDVAVVVQTIGGGASMERMAAEAMVGLAGLEPTALPAPVLDPAVLDAAVGTYQDPFNVGTVHVTRDGDGLVVSAPTLEQFDVPYEPTMTWYVDRSFGWTVQGYEHLVTFLGDDPGAATWLRTRTFVAERASTDTRGARPRIAPPVLR
jgi:hypothetical protein